MTATQAEWASLAMVLSAQFVGLTAEIESNKNLAAHCWSAMRVLERGALK